MASKLRTAALTLLILGAGFFAIALVSGILYEQIERGKDRAQYPPLGRPVDIGGRSMYLQCSGAGRPAVILASGATWPFYFSPKEMFENGSPRPGYGWVAIQRELAKLTTTCWYDRAGSGWSDLGPYPRDAASQARDLQALLRSAGIPQPYVLVAEATAAWDALVFSGTYPAEVAGVVFVNGVHPDFMTATRTGGNWRRVPEFVYHGQDVAAQLFNRVGLYRLGESHRLPAPPPPRGIDAAEWRTIWHLAQSAKTRSALLQEIAAFRESSAQARAAGTLGDHPLVALYAADASPTWHDVGPRLQADLAHLSTRGKLMTVAGGSELIYQEPDAVVDAVRQVVGAAR